MKRNSYLISHAFRNYLWAALLSSACMQLTVMADAIVAGKLIGPDALTAINLAMPLTTFVIALTTLIGLGPAIMAAKAIGSRNTIKVNFIFSSAIYQAISIGFIQGAALYLFLPQVGRWLCSNEHILPCLMEYLKVLPFTFFFMIIVFTLVSLVEADGHPKFGTKAVLSGSLINVLLDIVLVKYTNLGIEGIALAMLANYVAVLLYFILRMKQCGISYQWTRPKREIINVTFNGLKEGIPMMANDLLYSLTLFSINTVILTFCTENELFFWAIFLQLLLLVMVVVDCAEGAILSIGSVLEGEKDKYGLRSLVLRVGRLVAIIVTGVIAVTCIFPSQIAILFGKSGNIPQGWVEAVSILSLMMLPFALTTYLRSVFQVAGNRLWGVTTSLGQFLFIVAGLYMAARWKPELIWWSFPITTWSLFLLECLYLLFVHHRKWSNALSILSLIPKKDTLDLSVAYKKEAVTDTIQNISNFLQENGISPVIEMEVNICAEELMTNIVLFQTHKTRSYMDVSIKLKEESVLFILKDSGRPFNPVRVVNNSSAPEEDLSLGLFLANSVCSNMTHKYMYGLNIVFAEFNTTAQPSLT